MAQQRFKLSERLPDILLESFFIVVALLLALALDQWRDEQKSLALANNAKAAIYAELIDNKKKLEVRVKDHQKIVAVVNNYIESVENDPSKINNLEFEYIMVLISNSAWNSAKMTQVVQSFSFQEITAFSQIYQMHDFFLSNQSKITEKVMEMGELDDEELLAFAKGLVHRLEILIDVNSDFSKGLAAIIDNQTH